MAAAESHPSRPHRNRARAESHQSRRHWGRAAAATKAGVVRAIVVRAAAAVVPESLVARWAECHPSRTRRSRQAAVRAATRMDHPN